MLSDDFLGRITLQAFRAGIPVYDDAARIEHVDGAILHRLDQQAEPALAIVQRPLRFALLGQVAGDLGEAEAAAAGIANRLDHGRGPEPAAVLADTPTLLLGSSVASGADQDLAWHIGRVVLRGKEQREMAAEYLRGPVALDPFGAGVPGADHAVAIQKIDRVVGNRIDQKLEPRAVRQVLHGTGEFEFHFAHITPWGIALS